MGRTTLYEMSTTGKPQSQKSRRVFMRGWDMEEWGIMLMGIGLLFGAMVIVTQLCEYTENHSIINFKRFNFMVCKLYLNKSC
jgi:hypothetical protein